MARAQSAPPGSTVGDANGFTQQLAMAMAMMAHTATVGFAGMTANVHSGGGIKGKEEINESECDEDNLQYPEIKTFFHQLTQQDPRRNLAECADALDLENYYNINEIAKKNTDFFTKPPFYLSNGNADFVIKKVHAAVENIKKGIN